MPLTVRKFNAQVKDPQSGQMVPAGLLSSDSLQAIEAAETAAVTEIQQKGAQTRESIPDDYTELSDSVDELKTQLTHKAWDIGSYNRFNPATITSGLLTKAGVHVDNASFNTTDFIPVTPGETMYEVAFSASFFAFYNADYEVVSDSNTPNLVAETAFTIPVGVHFVRLCVSNQYVTTAYFSSINSFDTFKTISKYMHDGFDSVEDEFDNVFLDVEWTNNYFINKDNGNAVYNTDYKCTDFIRIGSNTVTALFGFNLRIYNLSAFGYYDENKAFIESWTTPETSLTNKVGTINPPNGAYYIRFSCYRRYDGKIWLRNISPKKFVTYVDSQEQLAFSAHKDDTNYINSADTWEENSYIDANGNVASFNGFYASPFIELDESTKYYCWNKIFSGYYAFYNENKQPIEAHGNDLSLYSTFTTPSGTAYGRFTVRGQDGDPANAWINIYNEKPDKFAYVLKNCYSNYSENPCDYNGDEISVFNKILCIGDSLTSGTFNYLADGSTNNFVEYAKYSYPTFLKKLTGCDVINMGNGGKSSAEWYELHENDDLSGYDCAIIQLGVNDQIRYGEFGTTSQTAFTSIINKLKTENKNIKIFIANIIPALSYSSAGYIEFSDDLLAWVETINQTDPNVIPLDIQRYGHTNSLDISTTSDAYNCGHLSALGYRRLAEDYKRYISYYINSNKGQFKEVQFIGTDYNYDPVT